MNPISFLYTNIDMDLCNDMEEIARNILIANQYNKAEVENLQNPLKTLIEHKMFSISVRKRQVVYSKELRCPKGYEQALKELTRKIELGEDINPFLSTTREKTDAKDFLLYDWNIHHLHLTRRYHPNGRPKRSDYLLFVRYTDSTMYFIQIYPHQSNPFVKGELQKIVAHNWPKLLLPFSLDNGHLTEEVTDEVRAVLRKKHIISPIELDGKIYFPSGGGYASDGSSFRAVRESDAFWNQMKLMEQWILKNQLFIRQEMIRSIPKGHLIERLHFKLREFSHTKITIFEVNNQVLLEYNLSENICKFVFFDTDPIVVTIIRLMDMTSSARLSKK